MKYLCVHVYVCLCVHVCVCACVVLCLVCAERCPGRKSLRRRCSAESVATDSLERCSAESVATDSHTNAHTPSISFPFNSRGHGRAGRRTRSLRIISSPECPSVFLCPEPSVSHGRRWITRMSTPRKSQVDAYITMLARTGKRMRWQGYHTCTQWETRNEREREGGGGGGGRLI